MNIRSIKRTFFLLIILPLCTAFMPYNVHAAREGTEWATTYWYNASNSSLPRVLIIGDSIVRGYQADVRDQLAGIAYLAYHATSKSITDPSFLKEISYVLGEYNYEIILFNNGLHSLDEFPEEWAKALPEVYELLLKKSPRAQIVWINSTPLKDQQKTNVVHRLNKAASEVLSPYNLPTLDLYALMQPLERSTHWADNYHFHSQARRMQANAVSEMIKALLGSPTTTQLEEQKALVEAQSDTGPDGRIVTTATAHTPIIRNGDFKTDSDWRIYTPDGTSTRTWNQSPRHPDQRIMQLNVTASGLQLYQEDPLIPSGSSVEISLWLKSSTPADVKIYIRTRRPPYRYIGMNTLKSTEDWKKHTIKISVPNDYSPDGQALFFIFSKPGVYQIDNIKSYQSNP